MAEQTDYKKQFCKLIEQFGHKYSTWEIFNDFLYLTSVSMANCVQTPEREEREQNYLKIINKYNKDEQKLLVEMFATVVLALTQKPKQDYLGEIYHALKLHQHQKGQFFTPYHIAEFMSEVNYTDDMGEKGYITVNDPACGAGVMLIAYANTCIAHDLNYQEKVLFMDQDIDRTAVLMCYIQLSLLGCNAIVIRGDSLIKPGLHEDNNIWCTPMFYLNQWRFMDFFENKELTRETIMETVAQIEFKEETTGQLSLNL